MVFFKDPHTGQKKYYKSFRKYKEAQKAGQDLRALIDNGQVMEAEASRVRIKPMTFKEVVELKHCDWKKQYQRERLSKATFDDYALRLNVLNRKFGKRLLCDISKKDLLEHHQHLLVEHSPSTSNRYLFILKQVFKYGLEVNAIKFDPSADITYFNEDEHKRNKFLNPPEIDKLIAASQKTRAKFYMPALIYLGAEHGTSRQEALDLKWADIGFDFKGVGSIRLFRTKNKNERTEYLMLRTKQALLDWQKHLQWARHRKKIKVKDARFVFCRLDGTSITRFDSAWNRICKLAGIQGFHYHDLRHTFCSNLIISGSDIKDVKEMIGHKDISMTDRYSHLTVLHKRALQQDLHNYYNRDASIASTCTVGET